LEQLKPDLQPPKAVVVGKGGVPFDSLRLKSSLSFRKLKSQIFIQMNCLIFYFPYFASFHLVVLMPIGSIDATGSVRIPQRQTSRSDAGCGQSSVFLGKKGSVEDCTKQFCKVPFSLNKILVWAVLNLSQ